MAQLAMGTVAVLAQNAGFNNEVAIATAVAIAYAESSGDPLQHNDKPPDDSFGLWQINMIGQLGELRLVEFGLTDKVQLLDPVTNARCARRIYVDAGGSFHDWATYVHETYLQHLPAATLATQLMLSGGAKHQRVVLRRYLLWKNAQERVRKTPMHGADVARCQRIVGAKVDGWFGPVTYYRVRQWQHAHKLHQDGIVGPDTAKSFNWVWKGPGT